MAYILLPCVQALPEIPEPDAPPEKLCNAVFSLITNLKSLFLTGFLEKFMGNLEKDTYTVTGFAFCILTCAVFQMFYDL